MARSRDRWMLVAADHIYIARSVFRRALFLLNPAHHPGDPLHAYMEARWASVNSRIRRKLVFDYTQLK